MDSSSKKFVITREPASTPASISDARFVQSLLLATPLYFYYHHLTPPGYFSNLLKGLVHLRNVHMTENENVSIECGINLSRNATASPIKRKLVYEEADRKVKRLKDNGESLPRASKSPEQPRPVSPLLR